MMRVRKQIRQSGLSELKRQIAGLDDRMRRTRTFGIRVQPYGLTTSGEIFTLRGSRLALLAFA